MFVLSELPLNPFFLWVTISSQSIRELNLIDALQLTHEAQRAPMLLHLLVVVVEAADREIPRLLPRIKNNYALAPTATWSSNFNQLLLRFCNELLIVCDELLVCSGERLNHATAPSLLLLIL